jgi:SAM-dependent methyltransferase
VREHRGVTGEPRFRADLYRGTAEHYERYRRPYPTALMDDLRARVAVGPADRVVDLACGTGQIAFGLADAVGEVVAVDQEPELIARARRKADGLGVTNIHWITARAEAVELDGTFGLVAIGNAFHRLDRDVVARRLVPHLAPGGGMALLWSWSPAHGDAPWQHVLDDVLRRWMDALDTGDRVPSGWEQAIARDPHEAVLRRAGLRYEGRVEVRVAEEWTVESLIGNACSTSYVNPVVLGERQTEFEDDVRAALLACAPDGVFVQDQTYAYELARRTA